MENSEWGNEEQDGNGADGEYGVFEQQREVKTTAALTSVRSEAVVNGLTGWIVCRNHC